MHSEYSHESINCKSGSLYSEGYIQFLFLVFPLLHYISTCVCIGGKQCTSMLRLIDSSLAETYVQVKHLFLLCVAVADPVGGKGEKFSMPRREGEPRL